MGPIYDRPVDLTTLRVREVVRATPRARLLRLDLDGSNFTFSAGQAVMAGLHGSPLRKPYSIASAPFEAARDGAIELLIQVEDAGGPDPHLELAEPGRAIDIEGPFGQFGLPPTATDRPLLFVAGGTGIAPLRSMILAALHADPSAHPSVLYSARSPDELAYREELEALAAAGRLDLFVTVTRESLATWPGRRGRIDESLLKAALPSLDARCFICGPPALVRHVSQGLAKMGIHQEAILVEQYDE